MDNYQRVAPLILLCSYICRTLVKGPTISDAVIVVALVGLHAFINHQVENKKFKTIEDKMAALEASSEEKDEEIEAIKSYASSLKLSNQIRGSKIG